jgi:MerR family transcriptional regulator, copper efflux regulator
MAELTVGAAAKRTRWSPRMLRYLEEQGLVVPKRTAAGYRVYGLGELNRLQSLRELRSVDGVGIDELAFAARLQREPLLRARVEGWLAAGADTGSWIDWEQRKHERLLAA